MKFGFTFDFILMCNRLSLNCMNYVFFNLIAGGGMAATNCDSILRKCSFTMHIRFCMRSLIRPNAKPSRLNLACIDSSPCSPRRPKPTWLVFAHCRVWSSNRCGTVASGYVFP